MSEYRNMATHLPKRVSIIGAARSGIAAARYFATRGASVFVSDTCSREKLAKTLAESNLTGVSFEAGGHTVALLDSEVIILSPGVPSDLPILMQAHARNIPVWSEMELGFRASVAPFLAVTGSTGKSTTVSLAGAALEAAGIENVVAGNIGLPVIGSTPSISATGYVVAEVSSFQLETIEAFRPKAAAVLNLMKNHLDRYASEEEYYSAKKQIARNMTNDNHLILNARDERLCAWGTSIAGRLRVVWFGANVAGCDAFWCEDGVLQYRFEGVSGTVGDLGGMKLRGGHNHDNASVAAALAKIAGAADAAIYRGLCSFVGLPHRLEFVAEIDGVGWYNDSKSTTAESIECAVRAFGGGVVLIAGGKDKGCDFGVVRDAIKHHVRQIVLIGEAASRIDAQWRGLAPINHASTLAGAIEIAAASSKPGESVVFSPGCSSFDMFRDFEDRGDTFRALVRDAQAGRCNE